MEGAKQKRFVDDKVTADFVAGAVTVCAMQAPSTPGVHSFMQVAVVAPVFLR